MVNREQEQARLAAASIGPDGRAGRDLAWIVTGGILLILAAMITGIPEQVLDRLGWIGSRETNALLAFAVVFPVGAAIFAVRRYRDIGRIRGSLERMADHDSLTGLPNRNFLTTGFEEMLAGAKRQNARVGVLFVDLRGFKKVNDTYGLEVGDQLMLAVADRLTDTVADKDVVVRYGGDEFVVLSPDITNADTAARLTKRIIRVIEVPFERGDEVLRLSASVGIAIAEERCNQPDDVLRDADAAMFQAKSRGPGSYTLFDRSMRDAITPSTAEHRLREALESGEFRLYYQPIVSLWTRRMVGVEAQLRWDDPSRGVIPAEEFAPSLEDSGLIVPVGNWVLDEVCRQARRWQTEYPDRPALNIKVSISPRQLAQTDFTTSLRHALQSTEAEADRVCLEVTESALVLDEIRAWATLREAKALGVTLALADFGTGFSSLSYLRKFTLDLLRIDGDFVAGLGTSREDEIIVEHVIGMSKALGIVTVGQNIASEEQFELLRSYNCDLGQGSFFSPAQPPDVIDLLMERGGDEDEWKPVPAPEKAQQAAAAVVEIPRFRDVKVTNTPSN